MAHARQMIREAVGSILSASTADLWRYVYQTRLKPSRHVTPFLMVYVESEQIENITIHPIPEQDRSVNVSVIGHLRITDDEGVEDQIDAMSVEIETLLTTSALNTALGGKLLSLQLESVDIAVNDDENQRKTILLALDWLVRVATSEGNPETLR